VYVDEMPVKKLCVVVVVVAATLNYGQWWQLILCVG
jgi:hypothetical protein